MAPNDAPSALDSTSYVQASVEALVDLQQHHALLYECVSVTRWGDLATAIGHYNETLQRLPVQRTPRRASQDVATAETQAERIVALAEPEDQDLARDILTRYTAAVARYLAVPNASAYREIAALTLCLDLSSDRAH